jgi:hypothetical protein
VKLGKYPETYWQGLHFQPMRARFASNARNWGAESFLPWVNGVAEHIGDPVARLRFLRVAVPCAQLRPRRLSRLRRFMPLLELLVAALLIPAFTAVYVKFVKMPVTAVHRQAVRKALSPPRP